MSAADHGQAPVTLARGVRLQWEPAQNAQVLLFPEGMVQLNGPAGEILALCDGRSVDAIVEALETRFAGSDLRDDVLGFLDEARRRGWIDLPTTSETAQEGAHRHGTP